MSEMAQTADHLVVIGRGRLLADVSTTEFIEQSRPDPRAGPLAAVAASSSALLTAGGAEGDTDRRRRRACTASRPTQVGDIAAANQLDHARAVRAAGLARGGVHGDDPRQRRSTAAPARLRPDRTAPPPASATPRCPRDPTDRRRLRLERPVHRPTLVDVIRSEWMKLRTVRSTFWTLAVAVRRDGRVRCRCLLRPGGDRGISCTPPSSRPTRWTAPPARLAGARSSGSWRWRCSACSLITRSTRRAASGRRWWPCPAALAWSWPRSSCSAVVTLVVGTGHVVRRLLRRPGPAVHREHPDRHSAIPRCCGRSSAAACYLAASALFGFAIGLVIRNTGGRRHLRRGRALSCCPLLTNVLPGGWGDHPQVLHQQRGPADHPGAPRRRRPAGLARLRRLLCVVGRDPRHRAGAVPTP